MIKLNSSKAHIIAPIDTLDYFDQQHVELPRPVSPLEAWNIIMAQKAPLLNPAFQIRDGISSRFGVKRIGGFSGKTTQSVKVGDYLDFFLVEHIDQNTLTLTERDRHLDVMTCISNEGNRVSVTSSVQVHNAFGHAYMVPVGIAHKSIVRTMLRRLKACV